MSAATSSARAASRSKPSSEVKCRIAGQAGAAAAIADSKTRWTQRCRKGSNSRFRTCAFLSICNRFGAGLSTCQAGAGGSDCHDFKSLWTQSSNKSRITRFHGMTKIDCLQTRVVSTPKIKTEIRTRKLNIAASLPRSNSESDLEQG